ncbi:MAG TPA: phytanoyl-CoA dioxygenase family protein [Acidimicrobiales bacterium]|nr:phytanoyl-CoA dioxygenase family protein [Acidimicrobiales bacterium]
MSPHLTADEVTDHAAEVASVGWTIIEDAIEPDLIFRLGDDLARLERDLGITPAGNSFEGAATWRIYNLLAHGTIYQQVPLHPRVLPVVEAVLDRGCLVSSLSSIAIGPGEVAQPIHADDQLIPIPRPHPPTVCNTMWAITDFTAANGATRVIGGSHLLDHAPTYGEHYESSPALMRSGSVLIWHGSLWHGGGANTTDERRVGIAMNYCAGYIRQQENQQLGLTPALVRTFPKRLRQLVGYSVYTGLIGHIDKANPDDLLMQEHPPAATPMIWDAT